MLCLQRKTQYSQENILEIKQKYGQGVYVQQEW